jgi:hypothetical protein
MLFMFLFIANQDAAQPRLTQAIARALNPTLQLATRIRHTQTTTPQTSTIYISKICKINADDFSPPQTRSLN